MLLVTGAVRPGRHCREVLCVCDCGVEKWVRRDRLHQRKSCGCSQKEHARTAALARPRRVRILTPKVPVPKSPRSPARLSLPRHPLHSLWRGMVRRCSPGNHRTTKNYFDRGVRVCDRWRASFESFVEDMGPRPSLQHSLDRFPNQRGNYEPGNVRWATMLEQQRNRTNNVRYSCRGRLYTVGELAEVPGAPSFEALKYRLRTGWSVGDAVDIPLGGKRTRAQRQGPRAIPRAIDVSSVLALHRSGVRVRDIARRLGVWPASVWKKLKRLRQQSPSNNVTSPSQSAAGFTSPARQRSDSVESTEC